MDESNSLIEKDVSESASSNSIESKYSDSSFTKVKDSSEKICYTSLSEYRCFENAAQKAVSSILDETLEGSECTISQAQSIKLCMIKLLKQLNINTSHGATTDHLQEIEEKLTVLALSLQQCNSSEVVSQSSENLQRELTCNLETQIKAVITRKKELSIQLEESRNMFKRIGDAIKTVDPRFGDHAANEIVLFIETTVKDHDKLQKTACEMAANFESIMRENEILKSSNILHKQKEEQYLKDKERETQRIFYADSKKDEHIKSLESTIENLTLENKQHISDEILRNEHWLEQVNAKDKELRELRDKSQAYIREITELEKNITEELDNISMNEKAEYNSLRAEVLRLRQQMGESEVRCKRFQANSRDLEEKVRSLNEFNSQASIALYAVHKYMVKLQKQYRVNLKMIKKSNKELNGAASEFINDIIRALKPILSREGETFLSAYDVGRDTVKVHEATLTAIHQLVGANVYLREINDRRRSEVEENCEFMLRQISMLIESMHK